MQAHLNKCLKSPDNTKSQTKNITNKKVLNERINEDEKFKLLLSSNDLSLHLQGSLSNIHYLGYCYQYGIGIEKNEIRANKKKNEIKAFELYKEAAENDHIISIYELGNCYQYVRGTKKNEIKAYESYKEAAEKGHITLIYELGICYQYGKGTEENKIKAFESYNKAAEKGHIISIYLLEKYYQNGIGTEKNEIKAFKLYKEAYEKGHITSIYEHN
ncbi:hypothetical protein RclHR1_13960004 [Rhizophagus clarus]|uniref:HCP-like protein n=1 Tax=Rhizophagus clarus TaxID=94130 RepID=A0A2Z6QR38_9GLOM|nr:hypothetical protein RclHR1_13960004 [Rhizophagus clarus]